MCMHMKTVVRMLRYLFSSENFFIMYLTLKCLGSVRYSLKESMLKAVRKFSMIVLYNIQALL